MRIPSVASAERRRSQLLRWAVIAVAVAAAGYALAEAWSLVNAPASLQADFGNDYRLYMERARSWLSGDGFYSARQLTGQPYSIEHGDATYPPVALWLFVPFTILPAVLWWLVPTVIIALSVVRLRPVPWAWAVLAIAAAYGRTLTAWTLGNPSMWAFAFLTAGLAWRWPTALAAFKVTLAPFALVGMNRRRWWIGAGVGLLLCVPFGPLWRDFAVAMLNARATAHFGLDYVLGEWPIAVALLLVAVKGRRPDDG